jgi:hypothetical protein
MATITNNSRSPRILNTEQGPYTLQPGASLPSDFTLTDAERKSISRPGFLDDAKNSTTRQARDGGDNGGDDPTITDADRKFAETFIGRKLDDISDEEIAKLTEGQKAAVVEAEKDREQPRKTLLDRLG